MLHVLKNIFGNQFATGGLLLMIIGGLGVYLRALPLQVWEWLVSQTTLMITVTNDDAAFVWVKEWFQKQDFLRRLRRVDLDTTLRGRDLSLIPSPGRHWFWYGGRPFLVEFSRSENSRSLWIHRRVESFTFRTLGRRQGFLRGFVNNIVLCHEQNRESSLYAYNDGWFQVEGYSPRLPESVILPGGEMEQLTRDIDRFRKSKERYCQLGVPYHRGYLFYGPPGTGKSSLVSALAARFAMSIYSVNLSDFNDRTLVKAINEVPSNSVILFEDIDCMSAGKERRGPGNDSEERSPKGKKKKESTEEFGVTLSGLLNLLDGFNAPTEVIFAMTSNQIGSIDQALLRPGRIDYKLYLGFATDQQKARLFGRFFLEASDSEACEFVETHREAKTMAEFQSLLLTMTEDAILVRSIETMDEEETLATVMQN